jgi:hypothetical protein
LSVFNVIAWLWQGHRAGDGQTQQGLARLEQVRDLRQVEKLEIREPAARRC